MSDRKLYKKLPDGTFVEYEMWESGIINPGFVSNHLSIIPFIPLIIFLILVFIKLVFC